MNEVIKELDLGNASSYRGRAEDINQKFDFIVCRAVAKIDSLLNWTNNNYKQKSINALTNGLIALKGGDLSEEMADVKEYYEIHNLDSYFEEEFFKTKKLVYIRED